MLFRSSERRRSVHLGVICVLPLRRSKLCIAALLALAASANVTHAATADSSYPAKPIRMLVGFPPGGGNDEIARLVGPKLAEKSGRPVVIDNRPGAGGNLAAELTAKAPADGYTILVISSSHPIQGLLKKNLPYDPVRDFAGVAELVRSEEHTSELQSH